MKWNTTEPPKSTTKTIKIRYKCDVTGTIHTGTFIWSKGEDAFIQCTAGDDGVGLYEGDYTILGWKERK